MFYSSEDGVVVGYAAAEQAEKNSRNTIYDAKRFIGKHFTNDELASEAKSYAFEVTKIMIYFCESEYNL
jgi:stress 70 chaperone-associated protein